MPPELEMSATATHESRCNDGGCTTWIDEALDEAGEEYADAPRPACCEKDAMQAKEVARVKQILSVRVDFSHPHLSFPATLPSVLSRATAKRVGKC